MMRKAVRLIIVSLVLLAFSFMTSCQYNIGVKTEMIINEDGSGYRRMYYEYPFEKRKELSANKICDIIESNIDESLMTFKAPDNEKSREQDYYLFEIYINFDNLDEYKLKVQKILELGGVELQAEAEFFEQAGLLETMTGYKENFTTEQLLAWLEKAGDEHIQKYSEQYDFMHYYPENAGITVKIGDKVYSENNTRNGAICVDNRSLLRISGASISVAMEDKGLLSRTVTVSFDGDFKQNEQVIHEYYDDLLQNETNTEYSFDNDKLTASFTGDYDRIALMTEKILGVNCIMQSKEYTDELDAMVKYIQYNESISADEDMMISYQVANNERFMADDISATDNSAQELLAEYDGNSWNITDNMGQLDISFSYAVRNYVDVIEYSLAHKSDDNYVRTIKFSFKDDSKDTAMALKQQFDNTASAGYTTIDGEAVVFRVEGTIEHINSVQQNLLGNDNYISMQYDSSAFNLYNDIAINDNIYLPSNLYMLGQTSSIKYSFIPLSSDKINADAADNVEIENGQVYVLRIKTLNLFAVYTYIALTIMLILLIIAIVLIIMRERIKRSMKQDIPQGGYITSDGIIVLPSDMAVPIRKNIDSQDKQ